MNKFYSISAMVLISSNAVIDEVSAFSPISKKYGISLPTKTTHPHLDFTAFTNVHKRGKEHLQRKPMGPLFHMGHSHSHHEHHEHSVASNSRQLNRKIAMWTFSFAATIARALLTKRRILKGDFMAFLATGFICMFSDKTQRSIVNSVQKLNDFRRKIVNSENATSRIRKRDTREADRVTWIGVAVNLLLSIGKLGVGVAQHSSVLIADAGHSLSDLVSDFITLWSVQIARLPADEDHPYGHDKFEAIGSLFLSLTLIATGFSVAMVSKNQLLRLLSTSNNALASAIPLPGPLSLLMAGISIGSKEWLYRITKSVGEKLNSPVVIANAWHHRSDAYSSVLALLSIAGAMMGFRAADAAAGLLISGMICTTGVDVLVESVQQLSDSANKEMQSQLTDLTKDFVIKDCDVIEVTNIKARRVGSSSFCDVTLKTPPELSMTAAQAVEERWNEWITTSLKDGKENGVNVIVSVSAKPKMTTKTIQKQQTSSSPSAGLVELLVRQQALLLAPKLHQYPRVRSVTVHYDTSGNTTVDVKVKMTGSKNLSLIEKDAKALKLGLEALKEIDSAHVYLDLSTEDENKEDEIVPLGAPYLSALTPELHSMIFQASSHSHEYNFRNGLFGTVNAMNNTAIGV